MYRHQMKYLVNGKTVCEIQPIEKKYKMLLVNNILVYYTSWYEVNTRFCTNKTETKTKSMRYGENYACTDNVNKIMVLMVAYNVTL